MSYLFSERSKNRMEGVNPKLIEIANLALTLTTIDFGIPEDGGLRTTERQNHLFFMNVSPCDGYEDISYHQSGNALDFFAYVGGKASWKPEYMAMVACAFLQAASILGYKLEWGGLWSSKDMPHMQLVGED